MTIDQAKLVFQDYAHAILPTRNHRKEKNGEVADRFRVFLQLEEPITNEKTFIKRGLIWLNYSRQLTPQRRIRHVNFINPRPLSKLRTWVKNQN